MEQRTDETARRPGVAAKDSGPPPEEKQTGTAPDPDEDAGAANGHSSDEQSVWTPAGRSAADDSRDRGPAYPAAPAAGSFPASAADSGYSATSAGSYRAAGTEQAYPAAGSESAYPAESAYAGPTVDDGFGPPGSERDYPASSATAHDFPSSSTAGQDYGAAPSESIYGAARTQHDFSAPPYPAQVAQPRPQPESSSQTGQQPSAWQAATARVPRPQAGPKRQRTSGQQKSSAPARQAHLMVSRFEPWSVMKFSFMISLACFVILFVAVALLYGTLAGLGVFDSIQKALTNVTSGQGTAGVNVSHWFSASTILSYTALLGVLNVFLITAFATVGSVVYNLTAHLVGGVEVTLRETE